MAGVQKTSQNAAENINQLKKKRWNVLGGGVLNYGFIGIDSYARIKGGQSAPVAIGSALLTNAAFSLIPGGIIGAGVIAGAMAAPEIMNQLDYAAGSINAKKQQFGGNFQETDSQFNLLHQGITRGQEVQMHAVRRMANHARGAQKVY